MIDDDDWGALEAGTAFALAGYLLDRQTDQLREGMGSQRVDVHVHVDPHEEPKPALINAAETSPAAVSSWDDYIGQEPLKQQLQVHIASAKARSVALDHVLLASGYPGVGKTTMARLIAEMLGVHMFMLVPPFHVDTLHDAARSLGDREVLFIDEIHKLADHGKRAAENLLHILEERRLYLDEGVVDLADITVIGATTDADKLPETILDRFAIKPYFGRYDQGELCRITGQFSGRMGVRLPGDVILAIAKACRGIPRVARELVVAARDLQIAHGRPCTPVELLAFKELEPDGMTRTHIAYVTSMYRFFGREKDDGSWEYIAGEASMMNLLRETKQGIGRIERFLIERGLVDRTPRGRRLTPRGIKRAQRYIKQGKG